MPQVTSKVKQNGNFTTIDAPQQLKSKRENALCQLKIAEIMQKNLPDTVKIEQKSRNCNQRLPIVPIKVGFKIVKFVLSLI